MLFGVSILYYIVCCLLFKCKLQQINYLSLGGESWFYCYRLLVILLNEFPLPLCDWERLRYFIVALPWPFSLLIIILISSIVFTLLPVLFTTLSPTYGV